MVGVAVAQFAPGMDKQANLRRAVELVPAAVDQGARLVVLPEYAMFTAPATDHRFVAAAEPLDGRYVSGLRDLARDCGVYLVAGVNEAVDDPERFANTTVAVGPDGALLVCYRKLHLYDAFGFTESAVVRPGEITDPAVFTVDGLTFGVQTCYDLRFPEVTRRLADAGAHAVVLGAEWVPGPEKKEHGSCWCAPGPWRTPSTLLPPGRPRRWGPGTAWWPTPWEWWWRPSPTTRGSRSPQWTRPGSRKSAHSTRCWSFGVSPWRRNTPCDPASRCAPLFHTKNCGMQFRF